MVSPRRLLPLAVLPLAWIAAGRFDRPAAVVRAGDHHDRGLIDCSDCHVMHATGATVAGPGGALGARVGALLRSDVNELCLSCHDGSARASDVLGRNQGRNPGDLRQAGFLNSLEHGGLASTGHTLYSLDSAPGSEPPWSAADENGSGQGLSCINCHAPHGGQHPLPAYRNLRSDAGNNRLGDGLVTYNSGRPGANDLTRDVFVRRSLSYDESAVDFNEPDARDSAMARFCAGCHDRFHGVPGVDGNIGGSVTGRGLTAFVRHPSAGVDLGAVGGDWSSAEAFLSHQNRVKVLSPNGSWNSPESLTPTCISCHKAHGNDNPFGLIFRSGRGTPTENGDSQGHALEDLCLQCHVPSVFGS